jgi:hypothetical protein
MGEQREQVSFCFPTLSVMQMHLQKPCNFRYLGNGNGGSLGSKKKQKHTFLLRVSRKKFTRIWENFSHLLMVDQQRTRLRGEI